jgi:hypothetical protein
MAQKTAEPADRAQGTEARRDSIRIVCSDVQPKLLMPDADRHPITDRVTVIRSDLIVKSTGDEWPDLTQNEFICTTAAKRAGIDVPEFYLSDDQQMFVIERFDLWVVNKSDLRI